MSRLEPRFCPPEERLLPLGGCAVLAVTPRSSFSLQPPASEEHLPAASSSSRDGSDLRFRPLGLWRAASSSYVVLERSGPLLAELRLAWALHCCFVHGTPPSPGDTPHKPRSPGPSGSVPADSLPTGVGRSCGRARPVGPGRSRVPSAVSVWQRGATWGRPGTHTERHKGLHALQESPEVPGFTGLSFVVVSGLSSSTTQSGSDVAGQSFPSQAAFQTGPTCPAAVGRLQLVKPRAPGWRGLCSAMAAAATGRGLVLVSRGAACVLGRAFRLEGACSPHGRTLRGRGRGPGFRGDPQGCGHSRLARRPPSAAGRGQGRRAQRPLWDEGPVSRGQRCLRHALDRTAL